MSDEANVDTGWKIFFAIVTLAFNAGVIAWCIGYGRSENLLHQNALSWSYISGTVVLAGVGFGQIVPYLSALRK